MINWPTIYYMDIANYLKHVNMPGDFLHRLECDYKEGKGYRLFRCDFVKKIFRSPISKDSHVYIFKCKVTPSQRTFSSPYNVWATVQKKNQGEKSKVHTAHAQLVYLAVVIML